MKKILFLLSCLAVFCSAPLAARCADIFSGTLTDLSGEVVLQKEDTGIWLPLKKNMPLQQGDRIKTGPGAGADILLDDGSMIRLGPQTDVILKELAADFQKKSITATVFLRLGKLIANVKKISGKDSHFSVHTPTAIAGVRGTQFAVNTKESGETEVGVFDGLVSVARISAAGQELRDTAVMVKQGMEVLLEKAGKPSVPTPITGVMLDLKNKADSLCEQASQKQQELYQIIQTRQKVYEDMLKTWEEIIREKCGKLGETKNNLIKQLKECSKARPWDSGEDKP